MIEMKYKIVDTNNEHVTPIIRKNIELKQIARSPIVMQTYFDRMLPNKNDIKRGIRIFSFHNS